MSENRGSLADVQETEIDLRLGKAEMTARLRVTNGGLLAVTALVTGILLATAVLVRVAVREGGEAESKMRRAGA